MSCRYIKLNDKDVKSVLWDEIRRKTPSDQDADIQYSTIFTKEFIAEHGDWIAKGKEPSLQEFEVLTSDGPKLRSPETKLTEKGIKQAQDAAKDLSKIEISELYTSPLDRAIHTSDIIMNAQKYPYRGSSKIGSKLSENGKIINVNFPISSGQRDAYSRRAGDVIKSVLEDYRVLLMRGNHIIPVTGHSIQSNEESNKRFLQAQRELGLSDDNSNVEELMGKTFPELFNSYDRGKPEYIHAMAYFIASRLLQSSDNFSGRILSSLSKDKLVHPRYVRIENDVDRSPFYADGEGIFVNMGTLGIELDKFDDPEEFIKEIELILTEEVIHAVSIRLTSKSELMRIYNELTPKEVEEFQKTYSTADPELIAHEYIRTVIQEDIFGTSTAREANPWLWKTIRRALQYILEVLSGARDRFSHIVIQKIKDYIDRAGGTGESEDKTNINPTNDKVYGIDASSKEPKRQQYESNIRKTSANANPEIPNNDQRRRNDPRILERGNGENSGYPGDGYGVRRTGGNSPLDGIYRQGDERERGEDFGKGLSTTTNGGNTLSGDRTGNSSIPAKGSVNVQLSSITPPSSPITLYNPTTSLTPPPVIHLTAQQIKEMDEAGSRGEIYYMLTPEQSEYIDKVKVDKSTTPIQRALIDSLYLKPVKMSEDSAKVLQENGIQSHERVMLNEATHTYTDVRGIVYHSTTEGINGRFTPEQQEQYKLNREWGIDCDNILQGIVLGKVEHGKTRPLNIEEIETYHLPPDVKMDVYSTLRAFVHEYRQKGYIPLTQVVVASKGQTPEQNRAGSIDLLLISPDGTDNKIIDLKTSIRAAKEGDKLSSTYTSTWAPKEGSVFQNAVLDKDNSVVHRPVENGKVIKEEGDRDIKLSKELQHAVQVGSYAKMLELQGLPVGELNTLHLHLKILDGKVDSYKNEGLVPHPVENNRPYIDAIVPKVIDSDQWSELQKKVYEVPEIDPTDIEDTIPPAERIEKLDTTLEDIKKKYKAIKASAISITNPTTLQEIKNLVEDIDRLQDKGDIQQAMNLVLNYVSDFTKRSLRYISNDKNMDDSHYWKYLDEGFLIGKANNELLPAYLRDYLTDTQKDRFTNLKSDISKILEVSGIQKKKYLFRKGFEDVTDVDALKARLDKPIKDISIVGSYTLSPDQLHNEYLNEMQYVAMKATKAADIESVAADNELVDIGNRYAETLKANGLDRSDPKAWEPFYEYRDQVDRNGKVIGKEKVGYINPTGDNYTDLADKVESACMTDEGEWKEPIQITDIKSASPEDIAYNIELAGNRESLSKFNRAEDIDENGDITVGRYHHLDKSYTDARWEVMKPVVETNWEGEPTRVTWILRPGLTEDSAEVKLFRRQYQTHRKYWLFDKDKKGSYTGSVTQKEDWFPNIQYRVPNDHVDGDSKKESLLNPRWVKLNSPTNDLERAQMEFYRKFVETVKWCIPRMEGDAYRYMAKLGVISAQSNFFKTAAEAGVLGWIKYQWTEYFTALHKSEIESTDPEGVSRRVLRSMQVGNLRSQEKMNDIQNKMAKLTEQKPSMTNKLYKEQYNELKRQLEIESHKLSDKDIDPDMVKQLRILKAGAIMNSHKEAIEGKLLALEWGLRTSQVLKTNALGIVKKDAAGNPVLKPVESRNDIRACIQFLKNFYGVQIDESTAQVLLKRLQNLNSLMVMGFNLFNASHNAFIYSSNAAGHILSSRFGLKAGSWIGAEKDVAQYWTGIAKAKMEKGAPYGHKRPNSPIEAFMRMYRLSAKANVQVESGTKNKLSHYAFQPEEFAIDTGKVTLTAACLRSFQVLNKTTGETMPWKDAYIWDPNKGTLTLKEGIDPQEILHMLVKLEDIQTKAQGNYNAISQPALAGTLFGGIGLQFRRFIPPSIQDAITKKFEHRTLGTQEGTWRSTYTMLNHINEWKKNTGSYEGSWKSAPEYVKQNLAYDGIQIIKLGIFVALAVIARGIAEGVSEDDPHQRRWANWLAYMASRLRFEQQTFIPVIGTLQLAEIAQNPFPVQQVIRKLAEAVYLSAEYPFQADDERNYQNGVFRGTSKAAHRWRSVMPIIRVYDQWWARESLSDYEGSILGVNK